LFIGELLFMKEHRFPRLRDSTSSREIGGRRHAE
jgi:hypothetical protein